jgi:hypothetical protein
MRDMVLERAKTAVVDGVKKTKKDAGVTGVNAY